MEKILCFVKVKARAATVLLGQLGFSAKQMSLLESVLCFDLRFSFF